MRNPLSALGAALHGLFARLGLGDNHNRIRREIMRLPSPTVVKARLPRSTFTKKGPGVRENLRQALKGMTVQQRLIARKRGWDRGLVTPQGGVRRP